MENLNTIRLHMARYVATTEHVFRCQQTYAGLPYTHHLNEVAANVREYSNDVELEIAAWLHDILEDTNFSSKDLLTFFGERVYKIVVALTAKEGNNRHERNQLAYPKILATGSSAVLVKLCDRLANIGPSSVKMYAKEHPAFKAALFSSLDGEPIQKLWAAIEEKINQYEDNQ